MVTRLIITVALAATLSSMALAAGVTARVDREEIVLNETFTLLVEAPGQGHAEPNLTPLEKNFHILGTSRGTRVVLRDGRADSRTEWQISLMAKRTGELAIPPLEVANERSQPIPIRVAEQGQLGKRTGAGPDLYIETEVSPQDPVVQGQVTYIVRLLSAVEIREGALSEPEPTNATVERLGRDIRYEARRDGQRYQVTERRYAIFPQSSGELVIPPTVFDGRVPESRSALSNNFLGNRRGVFGADPFGSMFRPSRSIRRASEAVTLNVRPRPGPDTADPWLPAESLNIKERWTSEPLQFRVGEPGTRTITLIARGLTAAQLPELPEPAPDGFKVYPDMPTLKTVTQGTHLVGTREQKFAIVPANVGVHRLPEIRIPWWNTRTERWEEAVLPEREVIALPAAATAAAPDSMVLPDSRDPELGAAAGAQGAAAGGSPRVWIWSTIALLVVWLVTLLLWWRAHAARSPSAVAQTGSAKLPTKTRRRFETACAAGQAREARDALLAWSAELWGAHEAATLVSVARRVRDPDARAAIEALDRFLYVHRDADWDGTGFFRRVAPALQDAFNGSIASRQATALPELYPSR